MLIGGTWVLGQAPHEVKHTYDGSVLGTIPLADFDEVGGQSMITITKAAAAKIKELVPKENAEYGLRMRVVGGGCSGLQYQMELEGAPGANDKVFTSNGIKVFIDRKSALYLADAELDYLDSLMQSGFKITNPNAQTTCGCGQSFR
jgi:iron-sulfur cluster assembly accessory protein